VRNQYRVDPQSLSLVLLFDTCMRNGAVPLIDGKHY